MTRYTLICAAFLLAAPASAQDPLAPLNQDAAPPAEFDLARKKAEDCEGEKFVFAWGAGARPTKVTLCSKKDASRDDLVEMLDDAATKLDQSNLAEDRKVAIVQQIRAKIAELQGGQATVTPAEPSIAPVSPPAVALPVATGSAPAVEPQRASPPPAPATAPMVARAAPPVKPRLSFECDSQTDPGSAGPCEFLRRETRITVTAGEAVPDGIGLRFIRRGETRAEVALGSMRKGQSTRLLLPSQMCSGVSRTESQIEVIRSGQVVDSIGPFSLRC